MARADNAIATAPPFRIGATSFVYPADWQTNVGKLAPRVDDIELLFFEAGQLPSPEEMAVLSRYRGDSLSYTVHTPMSASLASEDPERRREGIDEVVTTIRDSRCLDPFAWILHVYLGDFEGDAPPADLEAWQERARDSLAKISYITGETGRLCVESLDYDYELIDPIVAELGLSVAWDVGHDHRDGRAWQCMLDERFPRLKVVQWHGTDPQDRDHRSLAFVPEHEAIDLVQQLCTRGFAGVLTLEVFRLDDFEESLQLLQHYLQVARG